MSQRSVYDELHASIGFLAEAVAKLQKAADVLGRAREAAAASGKPTDTYEKMRAEVETLMGFVAEHVIDTVRKMAEAETGSHG
jgi:hypothetical protein